MTLLGVRAQNHPQQVERRGPTDAVDDRRTPDTLWAPLHQLYEFTLDAAASAANAKLPRFFDYQSNGLSQSWSDESVWCNPPFSRIAPWIEKAWVEMGGGCRRIVMLVPNNRNEQGWWQTHVEPFRDSKAAHPTGATLRTEFLKGRTRFGYPNWTPPKKGDRPPFGCCLLIWERAA